MLYRASYQQKQTTQQQKSYKMQGSQIVKKRLNNLKKLSQNLKQSTSTINKSTHLHSNFTYNNNANNNSNDGQADLNLIKAIFEMTKHNASSVDISMSNSQISSSSVVGKNRAKDGRWKKESMVLVGEDEVDRYKQQSMRRIDSMEILSKFLSKSQSMPANLQISQHSPPQTHQQQSYQPLFPQNSIKNSLKSPTLSKNSSHNRLIFKKAQQQIPTANKKINSSANNEQEIISLREENVRLELEVKQLRRIIKDEKYKFEEIGRSGRASQTGKYNGESEQEYLEGGHCPYFRISEDVLVFVTKLSIRQQDYGKIEYRQHPIKLTLDKLLIKTNQASPTVSKQPPNKDKTIRLNLSNMTEVKYISNNTMLLIFKQKQQQQQQQRQKQQWSQREQQIINVFIKFNDEEVLHRWDLSIFVNFHILTNLGVTNIFQKYEKKMRAKLESQFNTKLEAIQSQFNQKMETMVTMDKMKKEESQQQLLTMSDKDILIKYLNNKQNYMESQKKLRTIMLQKIQQKKIINYNITNSNSSNKIKQQSEGINKQNIRVGKILEGYQQEVVDQNSSEDEGQQFILNDVNKNEKVDNQQRQRELQKQRIVRRQQQQKRNIQMQKQMMEQFKKKREAEQRNIRQAEARKLDQAITFLQKGIQITKYSKSAFNPHTKLLYLDHSRTRLCWQDISPTTKQQKYIGIEQIEQICQGQINEGVKAHIDEKKIKNIRCFVTIKTSSKDRKNIQFSCRVLKDIDCFVECLESFLRASKKEARGRREGGSE